MVLMHDYATSVPIAWCPGCGNFAILQALRKALVELNTEPHEILFVSGIGQAPKLPHYTRGNFFNGLHGRSLPVATGIKIANNELVVIAIDGDGGAYGEGLNHLLAAIRRNINVTYMVHNNQVYGLTKGQASPTSDTGFVTKTTPFGAIQALNPIALAIASDASFVARGFAGDVDHLTEILKLGIEHEGFALIDILQPCVSFNHQNTYQWYKERVYRIGDLSGYDVGDKLAAFAKSQEWDDKIPIGIIYKGQRPLFEAQMTTIAKTSLARLKIDPRQYNELLDDFTL